MMMFTQKCEFCHKKFRSEKLGSVCPACKKKIEMATNQKSDELKQLSTRW